jgi:hypothetical protein
VILGTGGEVTLISALVLGLGAAMPFAAASSIVSVIVTSTPDGLCGKEKTW